MTEVKNHHIIYNPYRECQTRLEAAVNELNRFIQSQEGKTWFDCLHTLIVDDAAELLRTIEKKESEQK